MRTATEPVPFNWCGAWAKAARRSASRSSLARTRARPMSPSDAVAAVAAAAGSTPSATRRSATTSVPIARKSMRTQRDEIVMRSFGTKSQSTRNIVDGGGSSIVLSIIAAPSGRSRWNSSRISTLRSPSVGASDDTRTISRACSAEIEAPARRISRTSGCAPSRIRRASRWSASSPPEMRRAAKARAAGSFVEPLGPTKR